MRRAKRHLAFVLAACVLAGCQSRNYEAIVRPVRHGDLGVARQAVLAEQARPNDQLLREATLAILTLDDGLPERAEVPMQRVYETLRTRGLNANKRAGEVIVQESVKNWKGEPYEQALMYLCVAMQQGMMGEWGNCRAASDSALDLIDEFDRARGTAREPPETEHGYVVSSSDLALAHLLSAVANMQLGRTDEALDHLERVATDRPALKSLAEELGGGGYDTVLVVEVGAGPVLEATGAAGAEASLRFRWPADDRELVVRDQRGEVARAARALDVNGFAATYLWDNLAKVRRAKAGGGAIMTGVGAVLIGNDDEGARWGGLGLIVGGLLSQAGAKADERSLNVLPERYYVVPIKASAIEGPVEVSIGAGPGERLVLPDFGRSDDEVRLIVVRVPTVGLEGAGDGRVLYANDFEPNAGPGAGLPYILGGRSVMHPGPEALRRYQEAGYLRDMTAADLRELYRAEGIELAEDVAQGIPPGRHVLEGGGSLATPRPGTLGYVRLFCTEHPPYRPKSEEVARMAEEIGKEQE